MRFFIFFKLPYSKGLACYFTGYKACSLTAICLNTQTFAFMPTYSLFFADNSQGLTYY